MPSLTFPELDSKQIVVYMEELNVNLEEKCLITPTSDIMWPLYIRLTEELFGISREEYQQPTFKVLSKLQYPDLHQDSVACFGSFQMIRQLMVAAGVKDFCLRDITKPDSRRTMINLSGVVNYAKFRAEREDKLAALQDESLHDTKLNLTHDTEEVKRQIASIEAEKMLQVPAVHALQAETDELWLEVSALNKKQSAYQTEIRVLKKELTSMNDAISGQKYMLQQAKQEESDLKGQIVQSPEKLQKTIEEEKITLDKMEIAAEESRKSLNRWEKMLESYTKAEKKVQKNMDRLDETQKLLTTVKTSLKEVKALKAKIKADDEEERHRNTKLAELTRKGVHCQELIDSGERQDLAKMEEQERALEEFKERYSQMIKRQEEADLPNKEAQVQDLLTQIAEVITTKEEVIRNSREEVASIQQQVLAYYHELRSYIGPIPQLSG